MHERLILLAMVGVSRRRQGSDDLGRENKRSQKDMQNISIFLHANHCIQVYDKKSNYLLYYELFFLFL